MAAKRRPYHPPVLSDWLPPLAGPPGYIMGATGPQGFGTADFYVVQIPCATAREVIRREHYSHSVVNNSYLHLGVFREGAFEGVLQWGYALNPARAGKVVEGTVQGQYMELNRMWLSDDAPRNSESRAISYALKYIRRACPSVAWVQSFADERCQGLGWSIRHVHFCILDAMRVRFTRWTARSITIYWPQPKGRATSVEHTCGPIWTGHERSCCANIVTSAS